MQKSHRIHRAGGLTAALALVLAGCEGGALELVRDIEAARGDCGAAELRRSDESCVRMMEEYAGMGTELVHTYLGGLRALDRALERMPAPLFDTAGLGRALDPQLLPAARPGAQTSGLRPLLPLPPSAGPAMDSPMGGTFLGRGEDRAPSNVPFAGSRDLRSRNGVAAGGWPAPFGYARDDWGIIPLDPFGRPGYGYGPSGGQAFGYRYDGYPELGWGPYSRGDAGYGYDPYDPYRYGYPYGPAYDARGYGYAPGYGDDYGPAYDDRGYGYGYNRAFRDARYSGGNLPGASGFYPNDRGAYAGYGTRGSYGEGYGPGPAVGYGGAYPGDDYDVRTPAEDWGYESSAADELNGGVAPPAAAPPRHAPGVLLPPGERLRRPWLND